MPIPRRNDVLACLAQHRDTLHAYSVRSLALFGSVARDEATAESDIDILVEFETPVGMFEFLDLKEYLEELLGADVDLVTPRALKPHFREQVFREMMRAA